MVESNYTITANPEVFLPYCLYDLLNFPHWLFEIGYLIYVQSFISFHVHSLVYSVLLIVVEQKKRNKGYSKWRRSKGSNPEVSLPYHAHDLPIFPHWLFVVGNLLKYESLISFHFTHASIQYGSSWWANRKGTRGPEWTKDLKNSKYKWCSCSLFWESTLGVCIARRITSITKESRRIT